MAINDSNTVQYLTLAVANKEVRQSHELCVQRVLTDGKIDQLMVIIRTLISLAEVTTIGKISNISESKEGLFKKIGFLEKNILEIGAMAKSITSEVHLN